MYVKYSDLPSKAGSDSILLCQPAITTAVSADNRPTNSWNREFLEEAFKNSIDCSGLVHVCSLLCDSKTDEYGGPFALGPRCGGRLHLRPAHTIPALKEEETEVAITCDGSGCNMAVIIPECPTKDDVENLLLHLMLKQMVPSLPIANYVDCSRKEIGSSEAMAIRELGLISFASDALWGVVDNNYFTKPLGFPDWFSLGFMLMPGMNTYRGCGGYDKWLQLLVEKKFQYLKAHHRALAPLLLGPKLSRGK